MRMIRYLDVRDAGRRRIAGVVLAGLLLLAIHYSVDLALTTHQGALAGWRRYLPMMSRLTTSLIMVSLIVLAARVMENLIIRQREVIGTSYNLIRVIRLVMYVLIAIVGVSFAFQNLYGVVVSFGLISLVLGFALQAPITSFIAWLYIVFRRPYHVGDRIQLGELKGDVLDISYFDTIIKEFRGDYLGNDRLSGRIIHFPNSIVLRSEVINYSGQFWPFIWDETAVQIAYTSDLEFVEACLLEASSVDFAETYKGFDGEGRYRSAVYFRVNARAWLEAVVSYPVKPQDTTGRRNRILRHALPQLNAAPDRVQFPAGTQR